MNSVYSMYDKNMQPLYVGVTNNLKSRMYYHEKTREEMFSQLFYVEISEKFSDRLDALKYEKEKIMELQPMYNIQGKEKTNKQKIKIKDKVLKDAIMEAFISCLPHYTDVQSAIYNGVKDAMSEHLKELSDSRLIPTALNAKK